MSRPVITLTTDFGPSSPYVAQMKGVILTILREVELVDLTNAIPPQQILAGAVTLLDVCHHFPPGTIHVAVVDPGVGTDRAIVLAEMGEHFFVAPDNGLLDLVARRSPPSRIVSLETPDFWMRPISNTFHGRDIMAPVAAHFASGVEFSRFGPPQKSLQVLDFKEASVDRNSALVTVMLVDSFGNLVTNLNRQEIPASTPHLTLQLDSRLQQDVPLVSTYADRPGQELVALAGSGGWLELAKVNGNAGEMLDLAIGRQFRIQW